MSSEANDRLGSYLLDESPPAAGDLTWKGERPTFCFKRCFWCSQCCMALTSQRPLELILDWETVYIMSGTTGHTPTKIALTRFSSVLIEGRGFKGRRIDFVQRNALLQPAASWMLEELL